MIARTWHGAVPKALGDDYYDYIEKTGLKDIRDTKGNLGNLVFRRDEKDQTHFLLISLWDSFDSIKDYAGDDYTKARYYQEDEKFLKDFEDVLHYKVMIVE